MLISAAVLDDIWIVHATQECSSRLMDNLVVIDTVLLLLTNMCLINYSLMVFIHGHYYLISASYWVVESLWGARVCWVQGIFSMSVCGKFVSLWIMLQTRGHGWKREGGEGLKRDRLEYCRSIIQSDWSSAWTWLNLQKRHWFLMKHVHKQYSVKGERNHSP